ncbi:tau-cadinol synthase-like [Hordeum vulgare subsp. vulgare]|uniref:tau-cadinol synthase-like n=1 Tax=Hordeum vulgare subsp. vulgare TaxID=112509 RepID=UPI001D1A4F35|nr:tau-cadinol synthase-like [Hordeum vulgare subsp. vulgare]
MSGLFSADMSGLFPPAMSDPFSAVIIGAAKHTHSQRASCVAAAPEKLSSHQASLWGDYFLNYQPKPLKRSEKWMAVRADELKEEVCVLFKTCNHTMEMITLCDTVQHLGIDHHFKVQIDVVLRDILESELCSSSLHEVALRFRLLREHGLWVSPDVFNKFKNEDGSFREDITSDPRGLLSLYNAAHLLVHGEPSLQEAISFARHHLEMMRDSLKSPLAEHVKRALDVPFPRTVKRVETRYYISEYKHEEGNNPTLLELAKLDFNLLQHVHLKELQYLTKWTDDFYDYVGTNYVRDRLVESYFGACVVYHEKDFTLSRIFFTKVMALMTIIDDTYDTHATIEEIRQLNAAIQRLVVWMDESATSLLPDYLKRYYNELLRIFKDADGEAFTDTYHVAYVKKAFQKFSTYQLQEAEWLHQNQKPSFENVLNLSAMSIGIATLCVVLMVGMGDEVTKEAFEWALSCPNIAIAGGKIMRIFDDIAAFQGEKVDAASTLESYMVEHRVTSEVGIARINSLIEAEWKTVNEARFENRELFPVVKRIINLINTATIYYADQKDGYTFGSYLRKNVESLFVKPIPM